MTITSTEIVWILGEDEDIKDDGTVSSGDANSLSNLSNLENGDADTSLKYATLEPNSWWLNNTFGLLAASGNDIGFVSDAISDALGAINKKITVTFSIDHTIEKGVEILFSEASKDYCTDVDVVYKNSGGTQIATSSHAPDTYRYFMALDVADQGLANVRSIEITFLETSVPYRLVRVLDLNYDKAIYKNDQVRDARAIIETSLTALSAPISTADFTLYSEGDFDVTDLAEPFASLELQTPADVYEKIDGVLYLVSRFYLDKKMEIISANEGRFSTSCIISQMEQETYFGDIWQESRIVKTILASDLIDLIMTAAGKDYNIDAGFSDIVIEGWMPISNCREAIIQACLASGLYYDITGSKVLELKPILLAPFDEDYSFGGSDVAIGNQITKRDNVRLITLSEYKFSSITGLTDREVLYDGSIKEGTYRFIKKRPQISGFISGVDISLPDIQDTEPNYINIAAASDTTLLIEYDRFYDGSTNRKEKSLNATGEDIPIGDCTMVGQLNSDIVLSRLRDFYSLGLSMTPTIFTDEIISLGSKILFDADLSKEIMFFVTKNEIDLTGGFKQKTSCVGIEKQGEESGVLSTGKYNDDFFSGSYVGTWSTAAAAQAYLADIHFVGAGTGGSNYLEFYFWGEMFTLIYSGLSDRGEVKIYVDDVYVQNVDQFASPDEWQKRWDSADLGFGLHKIKIEHDTADGSTTDLDAIEIL